MEIALSEFLGPDDVVTPISPEDEQIRKSKGFVSSQNFNKTYSEIGARDVYHTVRGTVRRFVRNPKAASLVWPKKFYNHIPAKLVRERIGKKTWDSYFKFSIERNPWDIAVSMYYWKVRQNQQEFKDFIYKGGAYSASNYDSYCIDGVPALDMVMRYEELESDLAAVSHNLGLPRDLNETMKEVRAKGQYRKHRGYRDMYDDQTKNLISMQFSREIKLFDYEF